MKSKSLLLALIVCLPCVPVWTQETPDDPGPDRVSLNTEDDTSPKPVSATTGIGGGWLIALLIAFLLCPAAIALAIWLTDMGTKRILEGVKDVSDGVEGIEHTVKGIEAVSNQMNQSFDAQKKLLKVSATIIAKLHERPGSASESTEPDDAVLAFVSPPPESAADPRWQSEREELVAAKQDLERNAQDASREINDLRRELDRERSERQGFEQRCREASEQLRQAESLNRDSTERKAQAERERSASETARNESNQTLAAAQSARSESQANLAEAQQALTSAETARDQAESERIAAVEALQSAHQKQTDAESLLERAEQAQERATALESQASQKLRDVQNVRETFWPSIIREGKLSANIGLIETQAKEGNTNAVMLLACLHNFHAGDVHGGDTRYLLRAVHDLGRYLIAFVSEGVRDDKAISDCELWARELNGYSNGRYSVQLPKPQETVVPSWMAPKRKIQQVSVVHTWAVRDSDGQTVHKAEVE